MDAPYLLQRFKQRHRSKVFHALGGECPLREPAFAGAAMAAVQSAMCRGGTLPTKRSGADAGNRVTLHTRTSTHETASSPNCCKACPCSFFAATLFATCGAPYGSEMHWRNELGNRKRQAGIAQQPHRAQPSSIANLQQRPQYHLLANSYLAWRPD